MRLVERRRYPRYPCSVPVRVSDRNPLPVRARRGRRSARHVPRAVEAYARTDGEARRGVPCGRDARPPRRGALRRDDPPSAWQRHRPGDERGTPGRAAFWASAPGVDLTRRAVCGRTRARFVDRCSVASPPLATALSRPSRLVAQGRRPRVPGPAPVQAVIAARIDRLREGGAGARRAAAAPRVIRAGSPRIGGSRAAAAFLARAATRAAHPGVRSTPALVLP